MDENKIEKEEKPFAIDTDSEEEYDNIVFVPESRIVEHNTGHTLDIIDSQHPNFQEWTTPKLTETDFWSTYWKGNKLSYFYTYFPIRFLVIRKEFDEKVKEFVGLWTLFARVLITVLHFVALASNDYQVDYLRRVFSPKYKTGTNLVDCRLVPFGEIFAVFGENRASPIYKSLLYGTVVAHGRSYTADGRTCLPDSILRTHSTILILALAFLVELGLLHLEVGTYKTDSTGETKPVCDEGISYSDRVRVLRSLVDTYSETLFTESTLFFTPYVPVWNLAWDFFIENLEQSCQEEPIPTGFHTPLDTGLIYEFDVRHDTYECPFFISYDQISHTRLPISF